MKNDVILKSRVRIARNIKDYPFPPTLNEACRKEIIEKSCSASTELGYEIIKEINIINIEIKDLREEVKLCEGINDRVRSINENIDEYEKVNKEKGEKNYE